ncbi:MAG: hypothetical protein LBB93_01370 [Elusimicrobiota bacterium]|nr:hypothetical protein [Elusimicrobiota bacterium]
MNLKHHRVAVFFLAGTFFVLFSTLLSFTSAQITAKLLSNLSGQKIRIDFMSASLFMPSIWINKVTVNDAIVINKVLIKVSPPIFPSQARNFPKIKVLIADTSVDLDNFPASNGDFDSTGISKIAQQLFRVDNFDLLIEKLSIKSDENVYEVSNIDWKLYGGKIALSSAFEYQKYKAVFGIELAQGEGNLVNTSFYAEIDGRSRWFSSADGTINLDKLDFSQNISIGIASPDEESVNMQGKAVKSGKSFKAALDGSLGKLNLSSQDLKTFVLSSVIELSKIDKNLNASLKINSTFDHINSYTVRFETDKFICYGFDLGDFDVNVSKTSEGLYNIIYRYGLRNEIVIKRLPSAFVEFQIYSNGITQGGGWIDIPNKSASIDINNVAASKLPLGGMSNSAGTVSIVGSIDEKGGRIDFSVINFRNLNSARFNIFGYLENKDGQSHINFYTTDDFLIFDSIFEGTSPILIDFKFSKGKIDKILALVGITGIDITGSASGTIVYKKGVNLEADIDIFDGVFYGNKYRTLSIKGQVDDDHINLNNFTLTDENGKTFVKADGYLGFSEANKNSAVNFELNDFLLFGSNFNAKLVFRGEYDGKNQIDGLITDGFVKGFGISFENFAAKASISKDEISISKLTAQNGLKGSLKYNLPAKTLWASIDLQDNVVLSEEHGFSAIINADFEVSGLIDNLDLSADIEISEGKYNEVFIYAQAKYTQTNGHTKIEKGEIKIGEKGQIRFAGDFSSIKPLRLTFADIDLAVASKAGIFEGAGLKGSISGSGVVENRRGVPAIRLSVNGKDVSIFGKKVDEFRSNNQIRRTLLSVDSAFIKAGEMEIQNIKGFYRPGNGEYNLDMQLVNAQLSDEIDIFGKINVEGTLKKEAGGSKHTGKAKLDDFWINRLRLSKYIVDYSIQNNLITLNHKAEAVNKADMNLILNLSKRPEVVLFKISAGESIFTASGVADKDNFNLNVRGYVIDLDILFSLFDLDIDSDGAVDFSVEAKGDLSNPAIKFAMFSTKGSVMGIPYDYANIDFEVAQNNLQIKDVQIYKSKGINLFVSGNFPFWLDPDVKPSLSKKPINVAYSLQDTQLNALEILTDGFLEPRAGSLLINGSIEGTVEAPQNSGSIKISNAKLDMQDVIRRIKELDIDISWADNKLTINDFVIKSGNGQINVTGGANIGGMELEDMDIRIFTTDKGIPVSLSFFPISGSLLKDASKGNPTLDLTLTGNLDQPKLSGTIVLENSRFNYVAQPQDPSSLFNSIEYNVDLISGKNTRYENQVMSALINGSLNISGMYPNIKIRGIIDSQSGYISYLSSTFDIIDAKVEILNNVLYITGEADTQIINSRTGEEESMRINVDRSTLEDLKLKLSLKSNPAMESKDVLSLINSESNNSNDEYMREASSSYIQQRAFRLFGDMVVTPFTQAVLRRTGLVDNFRVSYVNTNAQKRQASTGGTVETTDEGVAVPASNNNAAAVPGGLSSLLYGAKYSFEKNITNQMMFGYSIIFDQFNVNNAETNINNEELTLRHELEMKYRLTNSLFLDVTYELPTQTDLYQPDQRIMLQQQIRFGGKRRPLLPVPGPE